MKSPRLALDKLYRSFGFLWGEVNRATIRLGPAEALWAPRVMVLRSVFRQVWLECFEAGLQPTERLLERMQSMPQEE